MACQCPCQHRRQSLRHPCDIVIPTLVTVAAMLWMSVWLCFVRCLAQYLNTKTPYGSRARMRCGRMPGYPAIAGEGSRRTWSRVRGWSGERSGATRTNGSPIVAAELAETLAFFR